MIPSDSHSWRCSGSFAFISACTCTRVYSYQGCTRAPGNKKQCFSLKSDPAFYRVELLIADNPAAPPTLSLGLTPSFLAPPLLPSPSVQCLHLTSFLLPRIVSLFLLSLSFPSSPPSSHKRARILRRCLSVPLPLCVAPCCAVLVGSVGGVVLRPGGASKADYVLILAKEAGNSFKPTKPFH